MQSLDVISVNLWQMLASLGNLVIIFVLVKKFLYKPVKKMLKSREDAIETQYTEAENTRMEALSDKKAYEEKLSGAKAEADGIIQSAVNLARAREAEIITKAKNDADIIVNRGKQDAQLELMKAEKTIKQEIVDVSTLLTEKMLEREIKADDHKKIIDSFIDEIGDDYGTN